MLQFLPIFKWNDENTNKMKDLILSGRSAAEIAKLIGARSRNAVIGKAAREGIPLATQHRKKSASGPRKPPWHHKMLRALLPPVPRDPLPQENQPPMGTKPLMELGPRECRWPHGDGPFFFCGQPTAVEQSYCPFHMRRAFTSRHNYATCNPPNRFRNVPI